MASTVSTGWRSVTPGPCTVCGSSDDYDCDGRGTVYCSCQCCAECGAFDGHNAGCSEPEPDDADESEPQTHWSYGSGMVGCLYDGGPYFADTREEAIDGALSGFDDLPEAELEHARVNLQRDGIHYFSRDLPEAVGADYVEVCEHDGPCPEQDD